MKHTISVLVEHSPGVLARIVGLLTGRGFNIDSIAVGNAEDTNLTRLTMTVHGNDDVLEQVTKQLNKIVDVIKVTDFTELSIVSRELALIKIHVLPEQRAEVTQIASVFRGNVVDISPRSLTLEVTGPEDKINACIEMVKPFGIKEIARTGTIALKREMQSENLKVKFKKDAV
ncbi:MAG: acetolactate synthase small subunit [Calditrichia bacterium]